MLLAFVLFNILAISYAQSYGNSPQNIITVPPNCPGDQVWINGACRDIWFKAATSPAPSGGKLEEVSVANIITVPPNCPPGQKYINGQCRDIFRGGDLADSLVFNQLLEKLWKDHIRKIQQTKIEEKENSNVNVNNSPRHIINVPNQCPIGYKADARGICRPIL